MRFFKGTFWTKTHTVPKIHPCLQHSHLLQFSSSHLTWNISRCKTRMSRTAGASDLLLDLETFSSATPFSLPVSLGSWRFLSTYTHPCSQSAGCGPFSISEPRGCLFLFVKCIGMTSVNTILQVSGVQFCNTSSICCMVCSPPEVKPPSALFLYIYYNIYILFVLFYLLLPLVITILSVVRVYEFLFVFVLLVHLLLSVLYPTYE